MTAAIRRGQVWTANLNPNRGHEVGKIRPVLVVQGDWLTAAQSRTVIVLPLTSDVRPDTDRFASRFAPATACGWTLRSPSISRAPSIAGGSATVR